jgi:hypothetical protein
MGVSQRDFSSSGGRAGGGGASSSAGWGAPPASTPSTWASSSSGWGEADSSWAEAPKAGPSKSAGWAESANSGWGDPPKAKASGWGDAVTADSSKSGSGWGDGPGSRLALNPRTLKCKTCLLRLPPLIAAPSPWPGRAPPLEQIQLQAHAFIDPLGIEPRSLWVPSKGAILGKNM